MLDLIDCILVILIFDLLLLDVILIVLNYEVVVKVVGFIF
jgi:hypothetical protein